MLAPGLRLSSTVSVPSLNIPASAVDVVVAGSNGVANSNITLRVRTRTSYLPVSRNSKLAALPLCCHA